jgi:tetratricopeptide (TPR) repeat protein
VLTPGSIVSGRWRIVRLLNVGPGSRVYLARGREDRTEAVLKVRPPRPQSSHAQQAVLDEFPIAAISHPNIVAALEGGVGADGAPWLAMELLEGRTLRERLAQEGALPVPMAAEILYQVADGIAAIHQKGFVHGSLDARSVFQAKGRFGRFGERWVILDFPPEGGRPSPIEDRGIPRGASLMIERPPDLRTDLYALGALAWECLAGRPGLAADGRRTRRLPVPLTLLQPAPDVPRELDDFVMRLLARDPDRRPASAREAADRFDRWRRRPGADGIREANGNGTPAVRPSPAPSIRLELREPDVAHRGTEMRHLTRALDEAAEGRGTVNWLEGEEGGGKSTLGRRFLALAEDRKFRVGTGRAAPGHRLSAWREALAAGAEGAAGGDPVAHSGGVDADLDRVLAAGPLALFLDDFQCADPSSADLLDRLARRLSDRPAPLVILVASRPLGKSPLQDEAPLHRALATIRGLGNAWRLPGMTDREIDAVTAGMSRRPFDPDLRALVRRAAAGNPMVAVHVLRHLAAEGALTLADGRVSLAPGQSAQLPDGLRQVLAARLDGLRRSDGGLAAAEVLDRIALLGRHATPTNLKALLDLEGRSDLRDGSIATLARLVAEGYVREVPWRPEAFLVPVHAGLREALEAERQGPDVGRRHLAAARVLEAIAATDIQRVAADLAEHYERAGFLDIAVGWLRRAADRAVTEGDVTRARDLLVRADGHLVRLGLPADRRRTDLLLELASWEVFGGRYPEAGRALATLVRECPPAPGSPAGRSLLEVTAGLEEARRHTVKATEGLERLAVEALEAGDRAMAVRAKLRLACLRMDRGDNRGGEALADEVRQLLEGGVDPRTRGHLEVVRARLFRKTGQLAEAMACVDRALGALTDPRDFAERIEALFFRAACLMDRDLHGEAAEVSRTGAALCEQAGYPRGLAAHLTNLASCMGRLGRLDEAHEAARRSLEIRERTGDSKGLAHVLTALADLALRRRDWANVRELSERALVLCRQSGYVQGERVALLNLAHSFQGLGDASEARRRLEACLLTAHRDDGLSVSLANAHLLLADLLDAAGERDAAQRHRLGAVVVFERIERPDRADLVRRMMGSIPGNGGGPPGA